MARRGIVVGERNSERPRDGHSAVLADHSTDGRATIGRKGGDVVPTRPTAGKVKPGMRNRMREIFKSGSVGRAPGNRCLYLELDPKGPRLLALRGFAFTYFLHIHSPHLGKLFQPLSLV